MQLKNTITLNLEPYTLKTRIRSVKSPLDNNLAKRNF